MKPRLKKQGGAWTCTGGDAITRGNTAERAYTLWYIIAVEFRQKSVNPAMRDPAMRAKSLN